MATKQQKQKELDSLSGHMKIVMYVEKADFMTHAAAITKMYMDNEQVSPAYTQAGGATQPPTMTCKTGNGYIFMTNPTAERMEELGFTAKDSSE